MSGAPAVISFTSGRLSSSTRSGLISARRREAVAIAVGEGPHLFAHHVGGFADTPREQRGLLEDRQLDMPVSGQSRGVQKRVAHGDELRGGGRQIVGYTLRGTEAAGLG